MIMHVSCCYELYEMYTFSFNPRRALLGHYTSYCILAAVAPIQFLLSAVIMWIWQCLFIYWQLYLKNYAYEQKEQEKLC